GSGCLQRGHDPVPPAMRRSEVGQDDGLLQVWLKRETSNGELPAYSLSRRAVPSVFVCPVGRARKHFRGKPIATCLDDLPAPNSILIYISIILLGNEKYIGA